jgi:hypothetical protein
MPGFQSRVSGRGQNGCPAWQVILKSWNGCNTTSSFPSSCFWYLWCVISLSWLGWGMCILVLSGWLIFSRATTTASWVGEHRDVHQFLFETYPFNG